MADHYWSVGLQLQCQQPVLTLLSLLQAHLQNVKIPTESTSLHLHVATNPSLSVTLENTTIISTPNQIYRL